MFTSQSNIGKANHKSGMPDQIMCQISGQYNWIISKVNTDWWIPSSFTGKGFFKWHFFRWHFFFLDGNFLDSIFLAYFCGWHFFLDGIFFRWHFFRWHFFFKWNFFYGIFFNGIFFRWHFFFRMEFFFRWHIFFFGYPCECKRWEEF